MLKSSFEPQKSFLKPTGFCLVALFSLVLSFSLSLCDLAKQVVSEEHIPHFQIYSLFCASEFRDENIYQECR